MPDVALDLRRLDQNITRFHQQVAAAGPGIRAHVKAHRLDELSARQVAAGAVGASVHTARTAIALATAGVTDVVVAWPWREPWRWPVYVEAAQKVERFAVHVDHPRIVAGLAMQAVAEGAEVAVRLDLRHLPDDQVLSLARLVEATDGVRLDGVTGYAGPETTLEFSEREALGRRTAERLVEHAQAIRTAGIGCEVVSVGGTPAAAGAMRVDGVTEIVAGAYATLDAGLAEAGFCALDEVAITVAADRADLLTGCTQPWAPGLESVPRDDGRLCPGHSCPLAGSLMRNGVAVTVVEDGRPVGRWLPRSRPDRA